MPRKSTKLRIIDEWEGRGKEGNGTVVMVQ